jgi:hypothetical protein
MVVTREEFLEWLELPVTKRLRAQIKKDIDHMQLMLVTVDKEDLQELQGRVKASINLLALEYEDLYE